MESLIVFFEAVSDLSNAVLVSTMILTVGIGAPYALIMASVGDLQSLARLPGAALRLLGPLCSVCTILGGLTLLCRLCTGAG